MAGAVLRAIASHFLQRFVSRGFAFARPEPQPASMQRDQQGKQPDGADAHHTALTVAHVPELDAPVGAGARSIAEGQVEAGLAPAGLVHVKH